MQELRKHLVDRFQEHLHEHFRLYCERHGLDSADKNLLLSFLIDQDLISPKAIQRYTVLHEYEVLLPELQGHKTETVGALAHRFSISERTVWNILKGRKGT